MSTRAVLSPFIFELIGKLTFWRLAISPSIIYTCIIHTCANPNLYFFSRSVWFQAITATLLISAAPFLILFFIPLDNTAEKEWLLKIVLR
jgi:hypothetical protein